MSIGGWILLADVSDVITALIVLAIMIGSALSQFIGKARENRPARPRRPAQPANQPQVAGPPAPAGRVAIEDEIGEFLRQAAQRRAPQTGGPPMAELAAQGVPPERPARRRAGGGPDPRQAARPAAPLEAEVVAPALAGHRLSGSEQLGRAVAAEEQLLRERLHEAFDHELSTIAAQAGSPVATPPTGAAQIASDAPSSSEGSLPLALAAGFAALLGSAETVQQAIVINEILTRPTHRWE